MVNWYLREMEGEIDSVEELAERKVLVEKVIDRLVQHVSCTLWHKLVSTKATAYPLSASHEYSWGAIL